MRRLSDAAQHDKYSESTIDGTWRLERARETKKGRRTYQDQMTALLHSSDSTMHPIPQPTSTSHLDKPINHLAPSSLHSRKPGKRWHGGGQTQISSCCLLTIPMLSL